MGRRTDGHALSNSLRSTYGVHGSSRTSQRAYGSTTTRRDSGDIWWRYRGGFWCAHLSGGEEGSSASAYPLGRQVRNHGWTRGVGQLGGGA